MKDFDAERTVPRTGTFKVSGEEFRYELGLSPETVGTLVAIEETGGTDVEQAKTSEQIRRTGQLIDREIETFLADDHERERWRELRSREKSVGLPELVTIQRWLWRQESGRDPLLPEPSSGLQGGNGTPSTETSSSGPAVASTPSTSDNSAT